MPAGDDILKLFEESPVENAQRCLELAPNHCVACGDFHLRSILRRMSVNTGEKTGDADEFRSMISLVLERLRSDGAKLRIAIIGSTDTGLLAQLMLAAAQAGGVKFAQSLDVTILDQCRTPLEICRGYAEKTGIRLRTEQTDFLSHVCGRDYDLVLMHGVLPFFPSEVRLQYLAHIAGWLKPASYLISSTHLGTKPDLTTEEKRTHQAISNLRTLAGEDPHLSSERVDALIARLRTSLKTRKSEPKVFADADEATAFYQAAGLRVRSSWIVNNQSEGAGRPHRKYKSRCIVLCQGPGSGHQNS